MFCFVILTQSIAGGLIKVLVLTWCLGWGGQKLSQPSEEFQYAV